MNDMGRGGMLVSKYASTLTVPSVSAVSGLSPSLLSVCCLGHGPPTEFNKRLQEPSGLQHELTYSSTQAHNAISPFRAL